MVNKDNIQEQILKDMLLKMNYDSSKTLSENIQEINIQSYYLINEQTDSKWKDRISKGIWSLQVGSERYEKEKGYEGAVEFIKQVQKQLGLPDTGVFDKTMKNKVVEFQKSVGEKPDGIIGKNTYGKLPKMGDSTKKSKSSDKGSTVFDIPDRTMQSDNTRIDPQYLGLMPDGKPIPPGLRLNYAGKYKPSPPSHQDIVYSSNISSYDRKMMMSKLDYFVTYTSPRLKKLTRDNKICSTYIVGVGGVSCKGIKGKGLLMKVYKADLEDWEEHQTSPPLPDDFWHWVLPIGALIITLATGGIGGIVIAGVLEAADIALYVQEKEYESAGIGAAFAIIPGGMLLNKIPFVKKFTSGALKTFLSKVSKGLDLSPMERKLSTELEKNADWIVKNVQAYAKLSSLTSKLLSKYTGKKLIRVLLHLSKLGLYPWKATWRVAALGGGLLTFMQIGKILGVQIKGLDYRRVELPEEYVKLSEEDKETFQKDLLEQVVNESTEIQESAKKSVAKIIETTDEEKVEQIIVVLTPMESEMENL